MPAQPRVNERWRPDVPGVAQESAVLTRRIARATVHGHGYRRVIRVRERTRADNATEYKLYAPGVGLVRELPAGGRVDLVRCER